MLDSIFDTDELPNAKIYETAHDVVSQYMTKHNCKIDVVAAQLGTTTGVLYRQLNPKDTQMPLSIDRLMALCKLTGDVKIIEAVAHEFDYMLVHRKISAARTSDINLLVDIASIENNDVFKAVKEAISDGEITQEERELILKEINEAQKANAQLKQMVLHAAISQQ